MFHRTASRLPLVLGSRKRFCEAKDFLGKGRESAFLAFRAPAKIACRVLREEERQAYKVMRQTKRAADQTALPRRGGALTAFKLGNGALCASFPDRARALPREKSRRKKRSGCRKATARICALRRRGDSFRLLRSHLPQRGRQGEDGHRTMHSAATRRQGNGRRGEGKKFSKVCVFR